MNYEVYMAILELIASVGRRKSSAPSKRNDFGRETPRHRMRNCLVLARLKKKKNDGKKKVLLFFDLWFYFWSCTVCKSGSNKTLINLMDLLV
jgi:hypothetical protein